METQSRRRCLVETASISSESYTISSRAFSQCRLAITRGASRGATRVEDLFIDIDADFSKNKVLLDLGIWRCSLRLRFPPCLAGANARTRAIANGIKDTHL